MRFKKWLNYKNMLIRKKIIIVIIPLIILPLLVVIYTSNYVLTKMATQRAKENIASESRLIVNRIQNIFNNGELCSRMFTQQINIAFKEQEIDFDNPISMMALNNQIISIIDFNLRAFKDIESISFIDTHSNLYVSDQKLKNNAVEALQSPMVKELKVLGVPESKWFPIQFRSYLVTNPNASVLTIGKRIVNINTQDTLGILIMNIKEAMISSFFPGEGESELQGYSVVNTKGTIISSQNKAILFKGISDPKLLAHIHSSTDEQSIFINSNLVTLKKINEMDWTLLHEISLKELAKGRYENSLLILVVGVVCTVIAIIGSLLISKQIAHPIIKLTKVVKHIREGNLNMTSDIRSSDEIGILSSVFNEMILKVKELLDKVKKEQRQKREYELALIQSQIKPHFFYNTLDLIFVQCEMGQAKEAANTTKALADFYKVSLSKGKEMITIREELKNAVDYLYIQQMLYSDIIDFKIDVTEEIMHYCIMKLTIQPLVENSIYHGLKPRMSRGVILIRGYLEVNKIIIEISDNGVGISEEKLQQLMKGKEATDSSTSFGLMSVNERLKLQFGDEFGINIESEVGIGTRIKISLPRTDEVIYDI
ncbi:cache domain-containing sensor histidine kinase [Cohnella silvisoli]|uniref:histidine kinase n=1 Tax=Cohnella silvisoli TaxID=2873699 RepID=A0ABV1KX23_9BACL|nr:sensor histidine kinase [Cohnella silvisoli]MCD9023523.1 sensor histidine kinase [Cohnella silvisoli]